MARRSSRGASSGGQFADLLRKGRETYEAGEQYEDMSFEQFPAGNGFFGRINLVEWRKSKNDNLYLYREHVVLEGEHAGKIARDHMMFGLSDFGDGKIRQYLKLITGEAAPKDPADMEQLVAGLVENNGYDCLFNTSYDDKGFFNLIVTEVYDIDEKIQPPEAGSSNTASSSSDGGDAGGKSEQDAMHDRVWEFIKSQKLQKEMDKKKRNPDNYDDCVNEVADWDYDEEDLSEDDVKLLEELELTDCIKKKEPEPETRRRSRR